MLDRMERTDPERPDPAAGGIRRSRSSPAPAERPAPRRLTRSRSDRVIAGVRRRHRAPLPPRPDRSSASAFVAGVILWGAGAVLYLAALFAHAAGGRRTSAVAERAPASLGDLAHRPQPHAGGDRRRRARPRRRADRARARLRRGRDRRAVRLLILAGLGAAWLVTGRKPAGGDAGQIAKLTLLGLGVIGLLFVLAAGSFWGAAAGGDTVIAGARHRRRRRARRLGVRAPGALADPAGARARDPGGVRRGGGDRPRRRRGREALPPGDARRRARQLRDRRGRAHASTCATSTCPPASGACTSRSGWARPSCSCPRTSASRPPPSSAWAASGLRARRRRHRRRLGGPRARRPPGTPRLDARRRRRPRRAARSATSTPATAASAAATTAPAAAATRRAMRDGA